MHAAIAERLEYEDELLISDALYARTQVRIDLRERTGIRYPAPQTAEEMEIYRLGDEAATRLVEAYLVRVEALAYGVIRSSTGRYLPVEADELISVGVEAAYSCTWAYDARGEKRNNPGDENANMGRRFSHYATPHILRMMKRLITEQSTPVSGNTDVIAATWKYKAAGEQLSQQLGRAATPEEIEAETGIESSYIVHNLPSRVGVLDIADTDSADTSALASIESTVTAHNDAEIYNGILEQLLRKVFDDDLLVSVFLATLGVDHGVPRSIPEAVRYLNARRGVERDRLNAEQRALPKEQRMPSAELRERLGALADLKRREVVLAEAEARDLMRHPQTRMRIKRLLDKYVAEGLDI